MKVSFIIPVYNVEKYLHECIRSILSQSYQDIEVILVDDGSKDKSPAICDAFVNFDKRVSVVHKKNGGLSDARNCGLQKAEGDYVIYIDGDDFWVDERALERLLDVVKTHQDCDFIGYNCSYYYPSTNVFKPWVEYDNQLSNSTDGSNALVALVKSGTFPMSACLKIMKRDFLIKNELYFVNGQIAEDIPWFINLLEKCDKCCFINQYIYAYRQNVQGSITNVGGDKSFRSLFEIVKTEAKKIDGRSFNKEAKQALMSFLAYELSILLTYPNIDSKTYHELKSYSWLLNYDTNPKVKQVKRVKKILGLFLTVKLLKLYQKKRQNKK